MKKQTNPKSWKLLASAPDRAGMLKMLDRYYYSTKATFTDEGQVKFGDKVLEGVRVILKGGRYRFEREE